MNVHFSKDRMAEVRENHDRWWKGTLGRPLVNGILRHAYARPALPAGAAPLLSQANAKDFSLSPEALIKTIDAHLAENEYLADGYPLVNFDAFGPGCVAAFLGAEVDDSTGAIWFNPAKPGQDISEIHAVYDPKNPWTERIKSIYRAGLDYWDGAVMLGMPDLGGVMDVAASLCTTEDLLYYCIDEPEEVERLLAEIRIAWMAAYRDFEEFLRPQKGYGNWSGLISTKSSYIIQCDFSYMISPEMFRQFVLPCLRQDAKELTHTIYHLDGVGELNHLDDILTIEGLDAVQWVYGDGKPGAWYWHDVYKKILDAGKNIMVIGGLEDAENILTAFHGTPYFYATGESSEREAVERMIRMR